MGLVGSLGVAGNRGSVEDRRMLDVWFTMDGDDVTDESAKEKNQRKANEREARCRKTKVAVARANAMIT